ncbi:MAG: FAD-binding protein [Candidatus Puniceispirillum sp.]|nr:FAD-binding protein [Candidatus Puniceispirillum sp.]
MASSLASFTTHNLADVRDIISAAIADNTRLDVCATGTKKALGHAGDFDAVLDVTKMAGVIDYQPEELILTLRAGTPLADVETLLTNANQMLAFDPPDFGKLLGGGDAGTIGGVMVANLSGPRRLTVGAARDFMLGFEAVSGRGELFKSGGKVVKNVTGYDLSKLICGSFGTLAVVDEITLKTLPRPETSLSLLFPADDMAQATSMIADIFATPHEPGSAAILPHNIAKDARIDMNAPMIIVVRLEGIAVSVNDRAMHLLNANATGEKLDHGKSKKLWQKIRDVDLLAGMPADVWKISCPPSIAAGFLDKLRQQVAFDFYSDWAGGLIWLSGVSDKNFGGAVRSALGQDGFAMLMRDVGDSKAHVSPFQPLATSMFELHKRVKAAFDPKSVLNFGRMHDGI